MQDACLEKRRKSEIQQIRKLYSKSGVKTEELKLKHSQRDIDYNKSESSVAKQIGL